MKRIILYHILPFTIAVAIGFGYIYFRLSVPPAVGKSQVQEKLALPQYFANYKNDYGIQTYVYDGLKNGTLVIIGSSELTDTQFSAIPYKFFGCIGIGHAGNQCLGIFSQLCAMSNALKNAKMVIIISPGWFAETPAGTSLESFLEFNNDYFLYSIYYNKGLPPRFKTYVGKYIAGKYKDIKEPSGIINAFYYDYLSSRSLLSRINYLPYREYYHLYCRMEYYKYYKNQVASTFLAADTLRALKKTTLHLPETMNWDSLYTVAKAEFARNSNNNKEGIDNEYFSKWIKSPHYTLWGMVSDDKDQELKDFKMLLQLLKNYHTDAYFIIQPLNPYFYTNLDKVQPIMDKVKNEITANGFDYYNLYVSDTTHYIKGTLNDIMHFGQFGWYRSDSAIYQHFYSRKNE